MSGVKVLRHADRDHKVLMTKSKQFQDVTPTIFFHSSKSLWSTQIQEVRSSIPTPAGIWLRAAILETVYHDIL